MDGWVGIGEEDADNFPCSCCARFCSRLSFNFGCPWDGLRAVLFSSIFQFWMPLGWEGEGRGIGKDGWVGIWGVDADNFCRSCSADAAVLVYLSTLDAPGMGGRGQGGRDVSISVINKNSC